MVAYLVASFDPKSLLARHGLRPKKSFGQNFLADTHLADRIAALAVPEPRGTAIEIGAGLGALTRPLLERAEQVVAIERDRDLCAALRADFQGVIEEGRLELLEADATSVDLDSHCACRPPPHSLAGNLPYQISGPLLRASVSAAHLVERIVFLVQLEVADRIVATPATPDYGALSVFMQTCFNASRALVVRRGAFYPQPRVDSAVVTLTPRPHPVARETPALRALVTAAFAQRRKKLRNSWCGVLGLDAQALALAAERAGVDLNQRGEALAPTDFANMEREISP
jgi:16S rRNA (adenine1518-N6/adenine1519-N6)-dimethyltransferase